MTQTYAIATIRNGQLTLLDLPLMSKACAQRHIEKMRKLVPSAELYIVNPNAI